MSEFDKKKYITILTVIGARPAHLGPGRRGGSWQGARLSARHAPGLLAQQRVEEVCEDALAGGGSPGLHSRRINLQ